MSKGSRVLLLFIPLLVALLVSQTGCGRIAVQADDTTRSSNTRAANTATPTGDTHDLAITAIDFDPALRSGALLATDNITLLVAVENRGNQVENNVVVEASLFGLPDSDLLVNSQGTIKEIAPGESQVVRFGSFSSIPLRSGYSLQVEVRPVAGETVLSNNTRTYKLEVTVASK